MKQREEVGLVISFCALIGPRYAALTRTLSPRCLQFPTCLTSRWRAALGQSFGSHLFDCGHPLLVGNSAPLTTTQSKCFATVAGLIAAEAASSLEHQPWCLNCRTVTVSSSDRYTSWLHRVAPTSSWTECHLPHLPSHPRPVSCPSDVYRWASAGIDFVKKTWCCSQAGSS